MNLSIRGSDWAAAYRDRRCRLPVPGRVIVLAVRWFLRCDLHTAGGVYARLGELGRAEEHHRRALAIFQRELGPLDTHVATALGNLSWIHLTRRELDRAEACRLRALDTHVRTRGPASPEALLDLHGLAAIYLLTGDETRVDRLVNHCSDHRRRRPRSGASRRRHDADRTGPHNARGVPAGPRRAVGHPCG
jgi:hypothetical protein